MSHASYMFFTSSPIWQSCFHRLKAADGKVQKPPQVSVSSRVTSMQFRGRLFKLLLFFIHFSESILKIQIIKCSQKHTPLDRLSKYNYKPIYLRTLLDICDPMMWPDDVVALAADCDLQHLFGKMGVLSGLQVRFCPKQDLSGKRSGPWVGTIAVHKQTTWDWKSGLMQYQQ